MIGSILGLTILYRTSCKAAANRLGKMLGKEEQSPFVQLSAFVSAYRPCWCSGRPLR